MSRAVAERPRALVLGTEHPRAAAVIRSLARAGIAVDVADHVAPATTLWGFSRLIRNRYRLPEAADAAVAELERLGADRGGVLIPTNDHYLIAAARNHERLSRLFAVAAPPWDVLGPLMDKVRCRALARAAGIEAPRQFVAANPGALDGVIAGLDFAAHDYVLKSRSWEAGAADQATERRVTQAGRDAESLRRRCLEILERTGALPVIEEVVPGGAEACIGVSMLAGRDGAVRLAHCVRRRRLQVYSRGGFRHPYELGANAYCESVHDEEAVALAAKLVRHARFHGVITVEFKRHAVDGRLRLIKADPRFVRATALSMALGLDLPLALYEDAAGVNRQSPDPTAYRDAAAWIWLEAYLASLWKGRRERPMGPELLALARRLPRLRAAAYFAWRDPLPAIARSGLVLRRALAAGGRALAGRDRVPLREGA